MKYRNIEIQTTFEKEESQKHLEEDFNVLLEIGIDNLIKENLIPWITSIDFKDKDTNKIFKGLKLFSIDYTYSKIIAQYSPTGEENYFGQFKFGFESGNRYTKSFLEAVEMEVYVLDGKIVKISECDI